jgi:hypothetical protein
VPVRNPSGFTRHCTSTGNHRHYPADEWIVILDLIGQEAKPVEAHPQLQPVLDRRLWVLNSLQVLLDPLIWRLPAYGATAIAVPLMVLAMVYTVIPLARWVSMPRRLPLLGRSARQSSRL